MRGWSFIKRAGSVALLAEGVDRNWKGECRQNGAYQVALLAEGVDRNAMLLSPRCILSIVALLAEGVDRNTADSSPPGAAAGRPPRGGRG